MRLLHGWYKNCSYGQKKSQYTPFLRINSYFEKFRSFHGIVANVQDCKHIISEFEIPKRFYIHFRTKTIRKNMKTLISSFMNHIVTLCCRATYIYKYMRNRINNNDNFNERANTLIYKNISLTLYSRKGWCWLCVRGELETDILLHIDPKFYWP